MKITLQRKLRASGKDGSIVLTLPKWWCRANDLNPGDVVSVVVEGKRLVIKRGD